MSTKVLYSLTDENRDLQKQIGCMNGIFQLFDRHHILSSRRNNRNSRKKLPPCPSGNLESEPTGALRKFTEKNSKKVSKERERSSTESSRTSISSSCSSTFSSHDCNQTSHSEAPFTKIKIAEAPFKDLPTNHLNASSCLRDIVKDSIYREAHGLSVQTLIKEKQGGKFIKHVDSPRPLLQSKSISPKFSGVNEPSRVIPNFNNQKGRSVVLSPKDAPRFSYDGLRDAFKSTTKIKELPRLSLDSRESSIKSASSHSRSNSLLRDLQRVNGIPDRLLNHRPETGNSPQPSSVVAKLMGLEALPNSTCSIEEQKERIKSHAEERFDPSSKQNQNSQSPRRSPMGSLSLHLKNADLTVKKTSHLKFPIEPAPWRQVDESKGNQKLTIKTRKASMSVYGEIENRLTELEFKKSSKDLRALKQILEAMQKTEQVVETKNNDWCSSLSNEVSPGSLKLPDVKNKENNRLTSAINKGNTHVRNRESPLVTVKPTRLVENTSNLANKQASKDVTKSKNNRNTYNQPPRTIEKNRRYRNSLLTETSKVPQYMPRENSSCLGAFSPRLQHKVMAMENHSCSSTTSRRQFSKQPTESGSPGRKLRLKSPTSQQGDSVSLQANSNISSISQTDTEVTSTNQSYKLVAPNHKNTSARLCMNQSTAELLTVTSEQPSPVSVLDSTFYRDDSPSPVKKISQTNAFTDDQTLKHNEEEWALKLSYDEATVDYITSICKKPNSDHRYITEILLASGFLSRDLSSTVTAIPQPHSSGHMINPNLFFVLETKRCSDIPADRYSTKKIASPKHTQKTERKLTFDTVNQFLIQKFASASSYEPMFFTGQHLLIEFCSEIDRLKLKESEQELEDEGDSLRGIIREDLLHQSENWRDFHSEFGGIVLGVERLIFKDLISEVVSCIRAQTSGHCCRQLFY